MRYQGQKNEVRCFLNFNKEKVTVSCKEEHKGEFKKIIDSSDVRWAGPGGGNAPDRLVYPYVVELQPRSVVLFEKEKK